MSFIKKLFFWTQSNRIREFDKKCRPPPSIPISYKFPRRDFYVSSQSHTTKLYRNQSSSTYDISIDNSVQCEIHDPPVWHKTSSKHIHKKSKAKKDIDNSDTNNNFDAPSIDISIDLPRNPKKFLLKQEIDITGIEDFIKKSKPQKTPIQFVFDDRTEDVSDKEPLDVDFSKLKTTKRETSNKPLILFQQHASDTVHDNKESDNAFQPDFTQNNKDEDTLPNQLSTFNLPKPKGRFIFDDNGDSDDEL